MGLFDKAKDAFEAQKDKIDPDKISQSIEKAGDFFDGKTGGKFADRVDKVQNFANDRSHDLLEGDRGPRPPAAGADPDPSTPPVAPPAPKPGPPPSRA